MDKEIIKALTQVTIADATSNEDDDDDDNDDITIMDMPIMSISLVYVIINELEQFCLLQPENEFRQAQDCFHRIQMLLYTRQQSSLIQSDLRQYFSRNQGKFLSNISSLMKKT